MTQNELSKLIGISQQEISRYEKGTVKAPISHICDLSDCCHVSVDYILGRRDEEDSNISDLNLDEITILAMYSKLSDENKIKVRERILTLLDMQ